MMDWFGRKELWVNVVFLEAVRRNSLASRMKYIMSTLGVSSNESIPFLFFSDQTFPLLLEAAARSRTFTPSLLLSHEFAEGCWSVDVKQDILFRMTYLRKLVKQREYFGGKYCGELVPLGAVHRHWSIRPYHCLSEKCICSHIVCPQTDQPYDSNRYGILPYDYHMILWYWQYHDTLLNKRMNTRKEH